MIIINKVLFDDNLDSIEKMVLSKLIDLSTLHDAFEVNYSNEVIIGMETLRKLLGWHKNRTWVENIGQGILDVLLNLENKRFISRNGCKINLLFTVNKRDFLEDRRLIIPHDVLAEIDIDLTSKLVLSRIIECINSDTFPFCLESDFELSEYLDISVERIKECYDCIAGSYIIGRDKKGRITPYGSLTRRLNQGEIIAIFNDKNINNTPCSSQPRCSEKNNHKEKSRSQQVMPYGKYKGEYFHNIPSGYLMYQRNEILNKIQLNSIDQLLIKYINLNYQQIIQELKAER